MCDVPKPILALTVKDLVLWLGAAKNACPGSLRAIIAGARETVKCEHVIIANCDFSPSAQLLEY